MSQQVFRSLRELPPELAANGNLSSHSAAAEPAVTESLDSEECIDGNGLKVNRLATIRKVINRLGKRASTEDIITECDEQYGVVVTKQAVYAARHSIEKARRNGTRLPRAPRKDKGKPRKKAAAPTHAAVLPNFGAPCEGEVGLQDVAAARDYLASLGYDTARAIRALAAITSLLGGSVDLLRQSVQQSGN